MTHSLNFVNSMKNAISNKKMAFFIGAGIDYHSGIPLVKGSQGIMTKILRSLPLNQHDQTSILNTVNLPFESFFSILNKHSSIDHLLKIFEIGEININHIYLAKLAKLGLVKTIVTTNFTQLLEKAFNQEGLQFGVDYLVIHSDEDMININLYDHRLKIIKIHGCISDKENLVITIEKVAKKISNEPRQKIIEYLFEKGNHDFVSFMGYSCSDIFDITPMISKVSETNKYVFFINHSFKGQNGYLSQKNINDFDNIFSKNTSGAWINYDTDNLIKALWEATEQIGKYHFLAINENIQNLKQLDVSQYIQQWLDHLISNGKYEAPYYISGELLNNLSHKKEAIKYYKTALKSVYHNDKAKASRTMVHLTFLYYVINQKLSFKYAKKGLALALEINDKSLQQIHYKNLGIYFRNECNFELALDNFKKALNIGIVGKIDISGKIYMEMGILFEKIKNHKEAKNHFEKALEFFKNNGSVTDQGWCLGHLGNIYLHDLKDYALAEQYYMKALHIAEHMGHLFNIGAWSGNLGLLYLENSNFEKAYEHLNKALLISRDIPDQRGEGTWLMNLAEYYFKINDLAQAIHSIQISIQIAEKKDRVNLESRKNLLKKYLSHDPL
jgi:tetratricopeptide (TPR) repeat protein/NAD-dependent SIR2 family protein deacetylase